MKNATEQQATQFAGVFVQHHKLLVNAPGQEIQWAIQNGGEALSLFIEALKTDPRSRQSNAKKTLTSLTTVNFGGTTKEQLIADIQAMPAEVSDYAKSMMANEAFTISQETGNVSLVALEIGRDLGFTKDPLTTDFMTAKFCAEWSAENLDGCVIELCQPEDGPQLRKKWKDQPKGTAVWMAMERIADSDGNPLVFGVERYSAGDRWLYDSWAKPDSRWDLGSVLVFRLRKITQNSVA